MSLFLILMAVGLVGLIMMAIPGLNRHGHVGTTHGIHSAGHGIHLGHGHGAGHLAGGHHAAGQIAPAGTGHVSPAPGTTHTGHAVPSTQADTGGGFQISRLIPSPRAIFSFLTLFGAFGFGLNSFMPPLLAGLIALLPAWGIEYFAVRPLWNLLFQFQGKPTTPLEQMVLSEAKAVTPFHNGRGIVSLEHDGRVVQLSARLPQGQAGMPVRVGDTLQIEEVDTEQQRVTVSIK